MLDVMSMELGKLQMNKSCSINANVASSAW